MANDVSQRTTATWTLESNSSNNDLTISDNDFSSENEFEMPERTDLMELPQIPPSLETDILQHSIIPLGLRISEIVSHMERSQARVLATTVAASDLADLLVAFDHSQNNVGSEITSMNLRLTLRIHIRAVEETLRLRYEDVSAILYRHWKDRSQLLFVRRNDRSPADGTGDARSSSRVDSEPGAAAGLGGPSHSLPVGNRSNNMGTSNPVLRQRDIELGELPKPTKVKPAESHCYLYVCITYGGSDTKTDMKPLAIGLMDDCALFEALRDLYRTTVGLWRRFLGLMTPRSIRFVQFRWTIHPECQIDRHSEENGPEPSLCLEILPAEDDPMYMYAPHPRGPLLPVRHELLMEFFKDFTKCKGFSYCKDRFPKALDEWPKVTDKDEVTAWGIEIVERRDRHFLFVISFIIFLGSLLAGIIASVYTRDVSKGFPVSAFVLTSAGSLMGTITYAFERRLIS